MASACLAGPLAQSYDFLGGIVLSDKYDEAYVAGGGKVGNFVTTIRTTACCVLSHIIFRLL